MGYVSFAFYDNALRHFDALGYRTRILGNVELMFYALSSTTLGLWKSMRSKLAFRGVRLKAEVFAWREEHQEAFERLIEALSTDTVLVYFDPDTEQEVHVDGCPLGISAALVEHGPKDDNWWVVQYASRALSETERNYSQTELELLSADFACRKFLIFLYGLPFTIVTDHKPLEVILNNPTR